MTRKTPAMRAGIAGHPWTIVELLENARVRYDDPGGISSGFVMRKFTFFALVVVPVLLAHGLMAPFWLGWAGAEPRTSVAGFSCGFTTLLLPAWIALWGCRLALRRAGVGAPFGILTLVAAIALNVFLPYALWGIGCGRFWDPDPKTVEIVKLEGIIGAVIAIMPPTVLWLIAWLGPVE